MTRLLPPFVGVLILVGFGVLHGLQTDRWGLPEKVRSAGTRLEAVPTTFGDWSSEQTEISEDQLAQAEAVGHLSRRYVNRADAKVVNVLIVCGRPGPIAVHPPTVCFTGAGWNLAEEPAPEVVSDSGGERLGEFWVADFQKRAAGVPRVMRTFWGWSPGSGWQALEDPRLETAHYPYLYKMYVTVEARPETTGTSSGTATETAKRFLRQFLPLLEETLEPDTADA